MVCNKCGAKEEDKLKARLQAQFRVIWMIKIDQEIILPISQLFCVKEMKFNLRKLFDLLRVLLPFVTWPIIPTEMNPEIIINAYHCWNCGKSEFEFADSGKMKSFTVTAK